MSVATNQAQSFEQRQKRDGEQIKSSIAMSVLLVSFGMLFATMMLGYAAYRVTSDAWPPMGMERVPLFYPVISTIIILLSSLTYALFEKAFFAQDKERAKLFWVTTIVLGLGFMASQFLLWNQMINELGYVVESGIFASLLHALTWVHAAHIVGALFWLLYLLPVFRAKSSVTQYENRVLSAGKFWHFLDFIWIIMFVFLFVL